MKRSTAAVVSVLGVVLASLVLVLGINIASQGAGGAQGAQPDPSAPVTTPISTPLPTVDPSVAQEMNGKMRKVNLAGGIKMHPPKKGLSGLAGNGQGNGCLKSYGKPGQCLPVVSPAQQAMPDMDHHWTCSQVRQLFRQGIVVRGHDTLGLDTDGDRIACGRGDG